MSKITIYKDDAANAIFIEDANGVQFINSLQATVDGIDCNVRDLARNIDIVTAEQFDQFVDENGNDYGSDSTEVCNALNTIFQSSGTPTGEIPDITSALAISLVQGETLNYELTANYGVGYEWDFSNVPGVASVEGNIRKIIGGSSLVTGTYNIPVKAINYNGEDSKTIVLSVSTPPFSNTKSINFSNQDWLGGNASLLSNLLGRSSNGSGSTDAWTISMYFKGSNNSQGQVVFYFGDNDINNGGYIQLMQINSNGNKLIRLRYGSNYNNLKLQTSPGSIIPNTWQHLMITYDGGTTGASSGSLNSYYSRFKIFIDGVLQTTNNSHQNYGYTNGIDADNLRVGRFSSGNYMRDCRLDELAFFDSDQSGNISSIYNGGAPFDLSTLTTKPRHWSRMGDGDTYPFLQDSGTEANLIWQMNNMTSADIVSDVP